MDRISLVFSAALLFCAAPPALSGKHYLFYTYTALSKPLNLPGVYEFTALGMLDDRELDYYSSKTQVKEPKQDWMRQKMPADYWEKGTQSRKSKEQWFKVNVDILIDRMGHNKTDLHVLQWRHGCVVNNDTNGKITFLSGVDEYSYDGTEFLSFDEVNSRWIAPVSAAEPTKRKWDDVAILNQYTKGYLERECVDWLTKFMDYGKEELRKHSPPELHLFFKNSVTGRGKLTLTCMATGFYPQDVQVHVRKLKTSLPEHLVTSSGVRPNGDGTYQLRKSVEITKEEKNLYSCFVNHITLDKPIFFPPEGEPCPSCEGPPILSGIIGAVVGVVVTLALVGCVVFFWKKKQSNRTPDSPAAGTGHVIVPLIPDPVAPNAIAPVNVPLLPNSEVPNNSGGASAPKTDSRGKDSDSGQGSSGNSTDNSREELNMG